MALGALCIGTASGSEPRPNFLLISIDTLRADHLGAYGYERPTSPNLDAFAAGGVLFENALAQSPWTLPSHASLLTGLYTTGHGIRDDHHVLARSTPVLTELMGKAGYRTGAIVNTLYLLPRTGIVRLVEYLRYYRWIEARKRVLSIDREIDDAIEFMSMRDARPFFLLLHTYDVHSDYAPAAEFLALFERPYSGSIDGRSSTLAGVKRGWRAVEDADIEHLVDLYDAAIRQLDNRLQRLFAHLETSGLGANTLVIIVSDHGEEFMEHGNVLHGRTLFGEMLRVPLIVRGPGVPSGVRVKRVTPLVDVAPTILARAGVEPPQPLHGRDLTPIWSNPDPSQEPGVAFAEADPRRLSKTDRLSLTGIRRGRFKLIYDRDRERTRLYDVEADPGEVQSISRNDPALERELLSLIREHRRSPGPATTQRELDASEIELLRALGYVDR